MKNTLLSILVFIAVALSGCNTTDTLRPVAAQIAVQYATLKVVENNPEYAVRIVEISKHVQEVTAGDSAATVAIVDALVRSQIKWEKLDAADRQIVDVLLLVVRAELEARIGSGILDPEKMVAISTVASWIEEAAALALPKEPVA